MAGLAVEPVSEGVRTYRRALFCACCVGFAFSANYTNHAPLAGVLMSQFNFSQALAGLLTTGIFLTHAAMQVPGGHLVDLLGARRMLAVALAWVAAGNIAIASSGSYWQLLTWKVLIGLGTGTCFVAGARYLHDALARSRLAFGQGLYGGSILLGSGFVVFGVPQISAWFGWRGTFLMSAAIAAGAWILWMAVCPPIRQGAQPPGRLRTLLATPQLWLLGLMQMASFGLAIVVGAWVVSLLSSAFGISTAEAGLIGSLVLLLGIVTRPVGGALRRRLNIRSLLAASFLTNAIGCFALASASRSLAVAATAVLLIGAGCGLPYAALFTRAGALAPGRAGAAMGLVNMLGICMILVGAPLMGHLADWTGSFRSSFFALGGFSLISTAAAFLIPRDEPASAL